MWDTILNIFKFLLNWYGSLSNDDREKLHEELGNGFEKIFRAFYKQASNG